MQKMEPVRVYMVICLIYVAKWNRGILIEKPVGSMVLLSCNVVQDRRNTSSANYLWWFNNNILFGSGYRPIDIGLRNVQVTLFNDSFSHLEIDCISSSNEGNYTCNIGDVIMSKFIVKVTGEGIKSAVINANVSWSCCFHGNHVWKFNRYIIFPEGFQPDDLGLTNVHGERINQTLTQLHINRVSMMNAGNYTCTGGGVYKLTYILRVHEIRLYLTVDGQNASEVEHFISNVKYNIRCSVMGKLQRKDYLISLRVSTNDNLNYPKDTLDKAINGYNTVVITTSFLSTVKICLFSCVIYDENGKEFSSERAVWNIYVVPQLIIQKEGRNLSGTYKANFGEIVDLKCVALGSRPSFDLLWKSTSEDNISYSETVSKRNEFETSTVNLESNLKIVVERSMILTCYSSSTSKFNQIQTELNLTIDGWRETYYIILVGAVSVAAILLLFFSQVKLRLQRQRRENAELFALSVWQDTMSTVPNGDADVSMVTFTSYEPKGKITDKPVTDGSASYDYEVSSQNVALLSRLHCGDSKEYWLGRYASKNSHSNCICETMPEKAHMAEAYTFLALIKRLRYLPNQPNIVSYLGSCTEEVPFYLYREYVDNGTLRDFLLRNYGSNRGGDLTVCAVMDDFNQTKPHPIAFARDVAEAMYFLQNHQFNHPALSTKKVLLDYTLICKLHDFWPSELTSYRVTNLKKSLNPPTGYFAPETIFLDQYDTLSDVWAYGIFLWELFSLGETPFQFKSAKEIEEEIRNMVLLPQPQMCPGAVYSLMLSTWNKPRENRPSFADVIHKIHPLQESLASEIETTDEWNEWDEWNAADPSLEEDLHNDCQYSVPLKHSDCQYSVPLKQSLDI